MSRTQLERLVAADISTLEALGELPSGTAIPKIRAPSFENIRHQAELQLHKRRTDEHRVDIPWPVPWRGRSRAHLQGASYRPRSA
ncbi:MAG: hypothetical protein M3R70_06080 [Actinomycetota bacterium]|nr:hypothetical protein [Actinomycetota bacterium]